MLSYLFRFLCCIEVVLLIGCGAQTKTCSSSLACKSQDVSAYTKVQCTAASACTGTHTWSQGTATSLTYECNAVDACNGLKIVADGTSNDVTLRCDYNYERSCNQVDLRTTDGIQVFVKCSGTNSCKGINVNTDQTTELTCDAATKANPCPSLSMSKSDAVGGMTLKCKGSSACGANGGTITMTQPTGLNSPTVECEGSPDGTPSCGGTFKFPNGQMGVINCGASSSANVGTSCNGLTIDGGIQLTCSDGSRPTGGATHAQCDNISILNSISDKTRVYCNGNAVSGNAICGASFDIENSGGGITDLACNTASSACDETVFTSNSVLQTQISCSSASYCDGVVLTCTGAGDCDCVGVGCSNDCKSLHF